MESAQGAEGTEGVESLSQGITSLIGPGLPPSQPSLH